MGFMDKLKNAASNASNAVKEGVEKAQAAQAEKKAEREAHEAEMKAKVADEQTRREQEILNNFSGVPFFDGIDDNTLLKFTNDFYCKSVLPASELSSTCIDMYHYIDERVNKKIKKCFAEYDENDTALIYLRVDKKTQILITKSAVMFSDPLAEDDKYFVVGKIPHEKISSISTDYSGDECKLLVNGICIFSLEKKPVYERDFISIEDYLNMVTNRDFDITNEEVDSLIRKKIGSKIYEEVRRKMTYDDELLLYFAWGLDSLSAKDYMFCTDKQIVYLDRAAFGATADVKQFYYEDINSMATIQNSNSSDLTGYIIDTALTAGLQLCDLEISVAGTKMRISTLKKREADRVVEIYHQMRKAIKTQSAQPVQVIQQAAQDGPLEQLKKLSALKEAGVISEDEFNAKKAELLSKI